MTGGARRCRWSVWAAMSIPFPPGRMISRASSMKCGRNTRPGFPTRLELQEGLALVAEAAPGHDRLSAMLARLQGLPEDALRTMLLSDTMAGLMRQAAPRKFLVTSHEIVIDAERRARRFASWYEMFPRSQSGDPARHGTFKDVIAPAAADRGDEFRRAVFPADPSDRRNQPQGPEQCAAGRAGRSGQPVCHRQQRGRA